MKTKYKEFNFEDSLKRIDDVLYNPINIEDSSVIPNTDSMNYNSGKRVECTSIFVDLRGSSDFVDSTQEDKSLGRLYQSYIREISAIMNSFETCRQINIVGDCVSAVFTESKKDDNMVKDVLKAASMIQGMMEVLNKKYGIKWKGIKKVRAGIGIAKGKALVMLAGLPYTEIKETIYMGEVVNKASKLCDLAYKDCTDNICVSEDIFLESDIKANPEGETFQSFFSRKSLPYKSEVYYHSSFHRTTFYDWANK